MKYIFSRLLQSKYANLRTLRHFLWNRDAITGQRKNNYLAEQMEVRNLLSADLAAAVGDQWVRQIDNQQIVQQLVDSDQVERSEAPNTPYLEREALTDLFAPLAANAGPDAALATEQAADSDNLYIQQVDGHHVMAVDTGVEDYHLLIDRFMGEAAAELDFQAVQIGDQTLQIAEWQNDSAQISVVLLDSSQNGLEQISAALSQYQDLTALHVLSHASTGEVVLGDAVLNNDNIDAYSDQLASWGESLTDTGDILFYGCNLAEGQVGFDFIERLAGVTKADIAASTNLTGSNRFGGDWILETETGVVEVKSAFATNDPLYQGVLLGDTYVATLNEGAGYSVAAEVDTLDISDLTGTVSISVEKTGLITVINNNTTTEMTASYSRMGDSDIENLIFGNAQDITLTLESGASLGKLTASNSTVISSLKIILEGTIGTNHINHDTQQVSRFGEISAVIFDKISKITGHDGEDIMRGDKTDTNGVVFDGGKGNDWLYGSEGNDTLIGGEGDDILRGYDGSDSLSGGKGDDTYVINSEDWGSESSLVTNITELADEGNDVLDLSKVDAGLTITITNSTENTNQLVVTSDPKIVEVSNTEVEVSHTTTGGPVTFDAGDELPHIPAVIKDVPYTGFHFYITDESGNLQKVDIPAGTITADEIRDLIGSVDALEDEIISSDVSAGISLPIPDVDLKPGSQIWMSLTGNIAFWNADQATADINAQAPDAYVENGANAITDINLSQWFTVPASGVASPAQTFTLALGYESTTAVGRAASLVEVTVPAKTYSGTSTEIKAQWTQDIQQAVSAAIAGDAGVTLGEETLKAPVTVNQVMGRVSMLTDSGSIAFWNSATTSGSITREVRGSGDAGAEILLMDYFSPPTSSSPVFAAKTFSLALGEYKENALAASQVAFQVTVPAKDYASYGNSSAMYKTWAKDIQNAIDQAFSNAAKQPSSQISDVISNEKLAEVILQLWKEKVEASIHGNGNKGGVDLNTVDVDINDEGVLFVDAPEQALTITNETTTLSEKTLNFSVNASNIETVKVPSSELSSTAYKVGTITSAGKIALKFDGDQSSNLLDLSDVTNDIDVDIFGEGQVKVTIILSSGVYVITAEGVSDIILGKGATTDQYNNVQFSGSGSLAGALKASPTANDNYTNYTLSYAADFEGDVVVNNTAIPQVDGLYEARSAQNADDSWVNFEGFSFNYIDLSRVVSEGLVFSANLVTGSASDDYISNTSTEMLLADAGQGNDILIGADDNVGDTLAGGAGNDEIWGQGGDDTLDGGLGDDTLFGGEGHDIVKGGEGSDLLYSSTGNDSLEGGKGDDSYVFSGTGWGGTTIVELNAGGTQDSLDFSHTTADVNFTIGSSAITVAVAADSISVTDQIERLVGGSGNNTYAFQDNWINTLLIDNAEAASVTLDFSAVEADLKFTIKENGTVIVADSEGHRASFTQVDNIKGGKGNNSYLIEKDGGISGYLDSSTGQETGKLQSLDYTEATKIEPVVSGVVTPVDGAVNYVLTTNPVMGKGIVELSSSGSYDYLVDPDKDFLELDNTEPATMVTVTVAYAAKNSEGTILDTGNIALSILRNVDGKLIVNGINEVQVVSGLNIDLSLDDSETSLDIAATAQGQVEGFGGTVKGINLLIGTNKVDIFIAADGIETQLFGDIDDDILTGGSVDDLIIAGAGMDRIDGAGGEDFIEGQAGADHITGGAGDDDIKGGDDNDYLGGGDDNDLLFGGAGDDIILGGAGTDSLVGGHGDDLYLYSGDWGQDVDSFVVSKINDTEITSGSAITLPSGASLTVNTNGSYTYTPNTSASSQAVGKTYSDTFTVTVENDIGTQEEITKTLTLVNGNITVSITEEAGEATLGVLSVDPEAQGLVLNGQFELSDWLEGDVTIKGIGNSGLLRTGESYALSGGYIVVNEDGSYHFVVDPATVLDVIGEQLTNELTLKLTNGTDTISKTINLSFTAVAGDGLVVNDGEQSSSGGVLTVSAEHGLTNGTNLSVRGPIEGEQGGNDTLSFAGMDELAASEDALAIAAVAAVSTDLSLTFSSGELSITDSAVTPNTIEIGAVSLNNIELIKGGQGDNNYIFEDLWGGDSDNIIQLDDAAATNAEGHGKGTLDFSNVTTDLVFTIEKETETVDGAETETGKVLVTVTTMQEVVRTKVIRFALSSNGTGTDDIIEDDDTTTAVYRSEVEEVIETVTHTVIATDIESLIGGSGENHFVFVGDVAFAGDIDGSAGISTLDYSQYSTAVNVDLSTAAAVGSTTAVNGTVSQMNNIIGTEFDDTLTGDANANVIDGSEGQDTISGGAGDDTLIGGDGDDTLNGGIGNDILDGGLGNDILAGGENDDTYIVDDSWADRNTLLEVLDPTQTERITDTSGNNTLDLSTLTSDLVFTFTNNVGGTQLDIKADVTYEKSPISNLKANKIIVNESNTVSETGNWTITSGEGSDTLIVKDGVEFKGSVDAGEGINTLDYFNKDDIPSGYQTKVSVNLETGSATGFSLAEVGKLTNIQNVWGSHDQNAADTLLGNDEDNVFIVGAWSVGGLADTIDGKDGNDTVSFSNFDAIDVDANLITDTAVQKASINSITSLNNIENLIGGSGADKLTGDEFTNIIEGGAGDDELIGGDGDDTYKFADGWGNDDLTTNSADTDGVDVLDFSQVTANLTYDFGRVDGSMVNLADALTRAITISDDAADANTVNADFKIENFIAGQGETNKQQANIILDVAAQDALLAGLETLKNWTNLISTNYTDWDELLQTPVPILDTSFGDLFKRITTGFEENGDAIETSVNFAEIIGAAIDAQIIKPLKDLFWGDGNESREATVNQNFTSDEVFELLDVVDTATYRVFDDIEGPNSGALAFDTTDGSYAYTIDVTGNQPVSADVEPVFDFVELANGQSQEVSFRYVADYLSGTQSDAETVSFMVEKDNSGVLHINGLAILPYSAASVDPEVGSVTADGGTAYTYTPGTFTNLASGDSSDVSFTFTSDDTNYYYVTLTVTNNEGSLNVVEKTAATLVVISDGSNVIEGNASLADRNIFDITLNNRLMEFGVNVNLFQELEAVGLNLGGGDKQYPWCECGFSATAQQQTKL